MSHFIQRLDIAAHPQLEKSLGYPGNSRWVAWHWEPEIDQLIYHDGQTVGTARSMPWQVFLQHNQVHPHIQDYNLISTDRHWLLLDRTTRNLYVGEGKNIQNLLEQPESLSLLACLDSPQQEALARPKKALRYFTNAAVIAFTASAIAGLSLVSWFWLKPQPTAKKSPAPVAINPSATCGTGEVISSYVAPAVEGKELHLVSLYEARGDHFGGNHPIGTVEVRVQRRDVPIVLALSSYEPVQWKLSVEPNTQIEKIIINGYHDQSISGVSNIPIEEYSYEGTGNSLGDFPHSWQLNTPKPSLVAQLEQFTRTKLTSFQGCYRGTQFTIQ